VTKIGRLYCTVLRGFFSGLRPGGHSYMSCQNVGFCSAEIHALSDVYTDTHDDGAVLRRFSVLFFSVIHALVNLCTYACYMF